MRKRILIVDDDTAVGEALQRVLEESGYTAGLAPDGATGMQRLQEETCDLLLLDLNLPQVSGFDILDFVGQNYPTLPVVVMTGQLEHCEPGALTGADALMEKPPDVTRLLTTIAALLSEPAATRLRRLEQTLTRAHALPQSGRGQLPLPKLPSRQSAGKGSGWSFFV